MPPAKSRVVDDARSETSATNTKDRTVLAGTGLKSKKSITNASSNANSSLKNAGTIVNGTSTATQVAAGTGPVEPGREPPHVSFTT